MTRATRALDTLLLGALLLTGCGGTPAKPAAVTQHSSPSPAPAPPAGPHPGSCYTLSLKQSLRWTNNSQAQACGSRHTSETYLVGELDPVADGHLLAVDSSRVQAQVTTACRSHLAGFLGGTPDQVRLSMVRPVWFTPTVAQSDQGADWYRCDAVVVAGSDDLAARAGSLKAALRDRTSRAAVAMCGTAAPTAKDFHRVVCSARHSWRATAVVPMKPGRYPGEKAARAAAGSRCEEAAGATAADPLSFQYGYEFPTAQDWANGQDYGICWAKD